MAELRTHGQPVQIVGLTFHASSDSAALLLSPSLIIGRFSVDLSKTGC
jgi:hypothetical protein